MTTGFAAPTTSELVAAAQSMAEMFGRTRLGLDPGTPIV